MKKPKLLWVKSRMPNAVRDGTSLVTLNLIECLAAVFDIDLVTMRITGVEDAVSKTISPPFQQVYITNPDNAGGILRRAAYRLIYFVRATLTGVPRTVFYGSGRNVRSCLQKLFRQKIYAGAVFEYYTLAPLVPLANCPTALLLIDATFQTLEYSCRGKTGIALWAAKRATTVMKRFEAQAIRQPDYCLSISDRDIGLFQAAGNKAPIHYVPVLYPPLPPHAASPPSSTPKAGLCFMGNLRYDENRSALIWFLDTVFPLIRQRLPAAMLTVIGGGHEAMPKRFQDMQNVLYSGWVEDLSSTLAPFAAGVAPSVSGTGVKIKVLEMMWHGVPVVATTIASAGTPAAKGGALIADDPSAFAEHAISLLINPAEQIRLRNLAWQILETDHCGPGAREAVRNIFQAILTPNQQARLHEQTVEQVSQ
ncbi:MAG: glycosyltransferase family 4 protein [Planctomycetia bacterium]|nr:glycosyltransferase family 4 protein [Planctomycetia bacterium]